MTHQNDEPQAIMTAKIWNDEHFKRLDAERQVEGLSDRLSAAQAEIDRLRGVLEWYGEEENHTVRYASEPETRMRQDRGQRARAARAALAANRGGREDE